MAKKFITKAEEKLIEDLLSQKLASYRPTVSFKEASYQRLLKRVGGGEIFAFNWKVFASISRWLSAGTATLVLVMSLGVTTGYAYFSPHVTSQSSLYFLKKSVEKVEYELAFSEEDKIKTLIKFNDRREEEIEILAKSGIEDKVAMKEIEQNLKESIVLLEKIEDVEIKKELYVLIEPPVAAAAKEETPVKDIEDEDDGDDSGDDDGTPTKYPIIVDEPVEENDEGGAGWNFGIILPPAPKMEISEDLFNYGDGVGGGEEAEDAAEAEDYDYGDDAFEYILEERAPLIVEPQVICKSACKTGASQACDGKGVQYCGDFDKNGCDEWGKCMPLIEEEEDDDQEPDEFFFEPEEIEIEIEPIRLIEPEPVITPVIKPVIKPINFDFNF